MITTTSIRIHSKCLNILDMIKTCNNRINSAKSDLHVYDHAQPLDPIRLFTERTDHIEKIEKYKRIKQRLVLYYADTMMQLVNIPLSNKTPQTI